MPELLVYLLAIAVNLPLNTFFVFGVGGTAGLGFDGSPIATDCTRTLSCLSIVAVAVRLHARRSLRLPRPSGEGCSPRRLRAFCEQALPQLLMAGLQEFGFAAVAMLANRLSDDAMAAHTTMMQIFLWLTSPLFGLMTACEVRIGNHLGAGNHTAARAVAVLGLGLSIALCLVVTATLTLGVRCWLSIP